MKRIALGLLALAGVAALASAQQRDFDKVQVTAAKVAAGVYMLQGAGGNIGVSVGDDGVFLIDDQYAPLTDKIKAAVAGISAQPIRFLLNTHWHGDHTGGNENLGQAGVLIVAHDNVRLRLGSEQFIEAFNTKVPASPKAALPLVTFSDAVTFHINGDEVFGFHVPPAHTDGDAVVHFRKANVVHMGDVFFNGIYPFVDLGSGGSVDGVVTACDRVLALIDDSTRLIPGHGPLASKAELKAYRDTIATIRDRVKAMVEQGKSLADVQAAKPTQEWDEKWGGGFIKPDTFAEIVYTDLSRRKGGR